MPIDARIALAGQPVDVAGSLQKGLALNEQIENRPRRNQLLDLQQQLLQGQVADQRSQTQARDLETQFKFLIEGAEGLEQILGAEGEVSVPQAQAAMQFLTDRKARVEGFGGIPDDTVAAMEMLQQGDFDGLRRGINSVKQAGTVLGYIDAPKPTTLQQNLIAAGLQPGTPEYQEALLTSINKPGVSITNNPEAKGLTEEQKALAKSRVGRFEAIQLAADNAIDQDEQLAQLENIDISTGFGTEARGFFASVVNAIFGEGMGDALLNVDLPALQGFRGVSARLVNSELNKAKGPQTEGDAQRAANTLANLSNEVEAN